MGSVIRKASAILRNASIWATVGAIGYAVWWTGYLAFGPWGFSRVWSSLATVVFNGATEGFIWGLIAGTGFSATLGIRFGGRLLSALKAKRLGLWGAAASLGACLLQGHVWPAYLIIFGAGGFAVAAGMVRIAQAHRDEIEAGEQLLLSG